MIVPFVKHFPRIQQHRALSQAGEHARDLERLDGRVLGADGRKKKAQFGDIPLAVAELVEHAALGLLPVHPEDEIVGAADGKDAQIAIQDHQGLADGIDDRLGQRMPIDVAEWFLPGNDACPSLRVIVPPRHRIQIMILN